MVSLWCEFSSLKVCLLREVTTSNTVYSRHARYMASYKTVQSRSIIWSRFHGFLIFFIDLSFDQPTEDPNSVLRHHRLASPVILEEENCLLCIGTTPVMNFARKDFHKGLIYKRTWWNITMPYTWRTQMCVDGAFSCANGTTPWCCPRGRCQPGIRGVLGWMEGLPQSVSDVSIMLFGACVVVLGACVRGKCWLAGLCFLQLQGRFKG